MAADIETLSYEQARDELVQLVQRLESGGTTLEESLALWERGEALATHCEAWLAGAKQRLEQARAAAAAKTADPNSLSQAGPAAAAATTATASAAANGAASAAAIPTSETDTAETAF